MSSENPWKDIKKPAHDFNVRKIPESGEIPLFWGRDDEDRFLFIVELDGDNTRYFRENRPSIKGMTIDLRGAGKSAGERLLVTLEHKNDSDLFHGLCRTLIAAIRDVEDSASALHVAVTHINRWKAFMSSGRRRLLGAEEVRGLLAELTFLRELYTGPLSVMDAVKAWCGPEEAHQDFIFQNTAVEVKSTTGRERNKVRISSEDQLESVCDRLFLKVFRLTEASDPESGQSLNDLAQLIEGEIDIPDVRSEFGNKLALSGYIPMPEYDNPRFLVADLALYAVSEEFPRLVRSRIPGGVSGVRYDLELEDLKPFQYDDALIWE